MNPPRAERTAMAVLGICFAMNMLGRGMSETFTVFLLPLEDAFGWSRRQLTGVYAVYMVVHGVAAPLMGMAFDRFGPRAGYGLGLASLGSGFFLASRVSAPAELYLYCGVLTGIGVAALSMVTASGLISRWFMGRMGTAMGIAYAGFGFGVIVIVPATQLLIDRGGWRAAYHSLGLVMLAVLPFVLLLPWRRWMQGQDAFRRAPERGAQAASWTLARALGSGAFWGMFAVFFFTASAIYSVSVQAVAYLVSVGFPTLTAATAFGFTGILSTCGMASAGWLSDRLGARRTVALTFSMTITGSALLMLLAAHPGAWLMGLSIFVFGLSAGSRGPVITALCARIFAGGGLGTIYGAITMGMGLGAAVGAWVSGALFDATGAYTAVFAFSIVSALCALAQFWLVPALRDASAAPNVAGSRLDTAMDP